MKKIILIFLVLLSFFPCVAQTDDPYLWLEDVDSKRSLDFVNEHNKITMEKFSSRKEYQTIYNKSLEIYNSTDRIAYPTIYGTYVYNFWQDKEHERGIWRRATRASYNSGNPAWEILLDIDAMAKKDDIKWVYKGANGLHPKYERFLVYLSKGGGDAVVVREFDVNKKAFIENGFFMEEAKSESSYVDENTLIIGTDFGPGTMTTSGYPRQVRLWKRGTPVKEAKLIFEGDSTDVGGFGGLMRDGDKSYIMAGHYKTFYTSKMYVWMNNKLVLVDVPEDSQPAAILNDQLLVSLKSDWALGGKTYKQGSLVSLNFPALLKGKKEISLVVAPDEFSSISAMYPTKGKLLVNMLSNVKNELYIYTFNKSWQRTKVNAPDFGTISVDASSRDDDEYYYTFTNFLTPRTLNIGNAATNTTRHYKSRKAFFNAEKYTVAQYKARSADGTMVPYFVVSSKSMEYNGKNPVLMYAYGGFEASEVPYYDGVMGSAWLENGGVYVVANIRGGGEYGPKWHQAGLKGKRQNVYNDFHAVAEDLAAKKITSARHMGILGGSNGGLLMGVAFTQRPDLYTAVVCAVPLLDMKRYNKLLAGASWMGEYGDPDKPEEWEYIKKYSPYHNLKAGGKYPEVFFTTSTRDDRVHPGHARKMFAKMKELGYPAYYYENTEGGHAGASTNEQRATFAAMEYTYLLMKLKDD